MQTLIGLLILLFFGLKLLAGNIPFQVQFKGTLEMLFLFLLRVFQVGGGILFLPAIQNFFQDDGCLVLQDIGSQGVLRTIHSLVDTGCLPVVAPFHG
ncbi:MAG: hypothetical protein VB089_20505 [Anaerolineaceae bacterium]|nr:hypothetical protein [Anaerolineaceae bacterium]